MPVPRINSEKYVLSEQSKMYRKADKIVDRLCDMGYNIETEREAVQIIERYNLNKLQFDYPYGSFDEFKKHVLAGEFDFEPHLVSKKEHDEFMKKVKEGKAWITY